MVSIINRVQSAIQAFRNPANNTIIYPDTGEEKNFPYPINVYVDTYGNTQYSLIDYETYAKEGYSRNEVVYAAIKYKQDSIAQSPLRAYTGTVDDAIILDDLKHPLVQLAMRPNPYMSRVEFMQYCVTYLNIHGNCFVALTGINDNLELGMFPLRPDRVMIIPNKQGGLEGYAYYPQGATPETSIPILPENMCHIKFPHPYDNLEGQGYGLSPMNAAAFSIDTDNLMTRFLERFFSNNGMMAGGLISLQHESEPDELLALRDMIVDTYGGVNQWGKPLVMAGGAKFQPFSTSFKDMALAEIDLRNIRRSTVVFGVPARLIGLDEANSTYNNIQEAKDDFWQRTMTAELMLFEEEFRHKIRLGDDVFLRFDTSGIAAFADDMQAKADVYTSLVNHFVPPNEAKIIAGLSFGDIEGGDISYMPVGLVPVKQKEVELDKLENEDENDTQDNPFDNMDNSQDNEGDMSDVPMPEDENKSNHPVQYAVKAMRWDYDTKDSFATKQDNVAVSYEDVFANAALSQFNQDMRSIMAIHSDLKKSFHKEKKSFDWQAFETKVNQYLAFEGLQAWRNRFSPLMIDVAIAARLEMESELNLSSFMPMQEFKNEFAVRSSIEGEYWFSNYTLNFAQSVNKTTKEDIHAIIRDGLANGYGTDKIGNKIELLFDQYMKGNVDSELFDFIQDRYPKWRTEMIARTETHGAMSAGNHAFYEITGVPQKEWWATSDDRTRETHLRAWNEYSEGGLVGAIGINEKFTVGGYECRYPGDRNLPLKEFINCRCTELPYYSD